MKKARTIEDVIDILDNEDGCETYRDVVDALVELGNTDDNLEFRDNLTDEFLNLKIDDHKSEIFEEEIEAIIDESNTIFTLLKQTLTPEELENYLEEKQGQAQLLEDLSL